MNEQFDGERIESLSFGENDEQFAREVTGPLPDVDFSQLTETSTRNGFDEQLRELVTVVRDYWEMTLETHRSGDLDFWSLCVLRESLISAQNCIQSGWLYGFGMSLLTIGNTCSTADVKEMKEKLERMSAARRAGGMNSGKSKEERLRQYSEWNARIAEYLSDNPGLKKAAALNRLNIPKSTYYDYGKEFSEYVDGL